MKKVLTLCLAMMFTFSLASTAQAGTVTDDFNDGNLDGWTSISPHPLNPHAGNWRIENGVVIDDEGHDQHKLLLDNYSMASQTIETKILAHDNGYAGITVWHFNHDNWVDVAFRAGRLRIIELFDGIFQIHDFSPTPNPFYKNTWYTMRVDADSYTGKLAIYFDDELIATQKVSTPLRTGSSGYESGNTGGEFDNFKLTFPAIEDDCKKDGWREWSFFKNQGECVSYVAKNENPNKIAECSSKTVCGDTCTHERVIYKTVEGADGKCWLDRNLGAWRVAMDRGDRWAFGWTFQWGRDADGHQIPTSETTSTVSTTDDPGHASFIKTSLPSCDTCDWRDPQNDNLWQGVAGINNPCPSGFRVPTQQEWAALASSENITDSYTAFDSSLKITLAGYRDPTSGTHEEQKRAGYFWTSTPKGYDAYGFQIATTYINTSEGYKRTSGFSVRCIQD